MKTFIRLSTGPIKIDLDRALTDRLERTATAAAQAIDSQTEGDFADFGIAWGTSTQVLAAALAFGAQRHPNAYKTTPPPQAFSV